MLALQNQLELFDNNDGKWKKHAYKEWGTFKDNLRAPIHRWFTYPAGFSYKAVETCIRSYGIKPGQTVYDPFMGSGTTNLTAKTMGIDSFGIEAHPFVFPIAKAKLNLEIRLDRINQIADSLQQTFASTKLPLKVTDEELEAEFPELVLKCYHPQTLYQLLVIRNTVSDLDVPAATRKFLNVGLTCILREVSSVQTGWP